MIKPSLMHAFILKVVQFDKPFHPLVLYENYLNLKMKENTVGKLGSKGVIRLT